MHSIDNTSADQLARRAASVSTALQTSPNFGLGFFSARWHATALLPPPTNVVNLAEERERTDAARRQRESEIVEVINGSAVARRFKEKNAGIPAGSAEAALAACMVAIITDARDPGLIDALPAWAFPILHVMGIFDGFPGKPLRSLNAATNTCVLCGHLFEHGHDLAEVPTQTGGRTILVHEECYRRHLQLEKDARAVGRTSKPAAAPKPLRVDAAVGEWPKANGKHPPQTQPKAAEDDKDKSETIAVRFLQRILPAQGVYQYWLKTGTNGNAKSYNLVAASIEELVHEINRRDANGCAVYHACATFKTGDSREQVNALGAQSLWADIDAGPGKAYADRDAALAAVGTFCKAANLPAPLIILSGPHGLHIYWPLAEMLDPGTWKSYAEGLKALCRKLGLHIDPACSGNISCVLRTPGTHHRKGKPVGGVLPASNPW